MVYTARGRRLVITGALIVVAMVGAFVLLRPVPRVVTPRVQVRPDADLERVEEELRHALGTKVSLSRSRKGGRIVIEYYSDEELGRLYERLIGGTA